MVRCAVGMISPFKISLAGIFWFSLSSWFAIWVDVSTSRVCEIWKVLVPFAVSELSKH